MKQNYINFFRKLFLFIVSAFLFTKSYGQLTLDIGSSPYTQKFNSIAGGLPTGWSVKTSATNSFLGTTVSLNTATIPWITSMGQFANCASSSSPATQSDNSATQNSNTNRAIAVRQTNAFGDPGAAFALQLTNTTGLSDFILTFKLMQLDPTGINGRTTTWNIDYGFGAAP